MTVQSKAIFSYDNFVLAVSGAVGSIVGMVAFYPLDTVRSRLQLEEKRESKNTFIMLKELAREEGFCTLYRGMVPVLQSLCLSNFIYFYAFHGLRTWAKKETSSRDMLLASLAGSINVLITSPLWMVNTKMKMAGLGSQAAYNGLIEGLVRVQQEEGIRALWRGTTASLILVCNPALHMTIYEALKRRARSPLSAVQFFYMSALAKAIATIITYPIQLVQTKLRHGHSVRELPPNVSIIQLLTYILKKQGVSGLFKGLEAKLLQTVLTAALFFMTYEKLSAFVFRLLRR